MNKFHFFLKVLNPNWISFWGALFGAIISGLFAIYIFNRGARENEEKFENELLDYGKFYYESVQLLQKNLIKEQLNFMDNYVSEIKQNLFIPHRLNIADGQDYMYRIRKLDIQRLHRLYFLLEIESKHLVNTINYLDYLDNQLTNYKTDARNTLESTLKIAKQAYNFYESFWELNKDYPSNIIDLKQMETLFIQKRGNPNMLKAIKKYRQQIERKNQAIILTYPEVRNNITDIQEKLQQEMKLLENKIIKKNY